MNIDRRRLAKLGLLLAGATLATLVPHPTLAREPLGDEAQAVKPAPAVDRKTMEDWWISLEHDEPEASRALLKLSDHPAETVAFLKEKMKPLTLSVDRLKSLLAKLGSIDQNEWNPAYEELDYFDPRLAKDLETLMLEVVDSPTRQRLVAVMGGRRQWLDTLDGKEVGLRALAGGGHNFFSLGQSWWAEQDVSHINTVSFSNWKKKWTRAIRAIVLLEHFGTPDAIALLKDMAGGHPLARPTREAAEALARIREKAR